jgi:hypothetical protein
MRQSQWICEQRGEGSPVTPGTGFTSNMGEAEERRGRIEDEMVAVGQGAQLLSKEVREGSVRSRDVPYLL